MSPDQSRRILDVLSKGGTQREAAEVAGISIRTLQRWLKTPEFRQIETKINFAVQKQTEALADEVVHQLETLTPIAISVLKEILENPESRAADRLRASALVIEWWQKQRYSNHKDILLQHFIDSFNDILLSGDERSRQYCQNGLDSALLELGRDSVLEILSKN
ncbi:MAG TPA: helix-turn-helix domain-containing protein [Allocoleopsis sp.]